MEVVMGDIKLVVFNNGLQLVGEFTLVDGSIGKITIKKPVQLVFGPRSEAEAAQGKVGMSFTPFLQYTQDWESGLVFSANDVLSVATPVIELVNGYNSNFGSGLVLPGGQAGGSGLILPR
jgi:hypothetical protein